MKKFGFTLIELLVVIGILSILAVALLIAINPAEAQRKARDTQRIKDLTNIQAALEGWVSDNPGSSLPTSATTSSASSARNCDGTGWLTINVCNYLNRLPSDPRNAQGSFANGTGGTYTTGLLAYQVQANAYGYHICTRMESLSNGQKMSDDGFPGGAAFFDVYSNTSAPACSNI